MRTKIGEVKVHETCRELHHYFDKTIPHDWTGPTVKIQKIHFDLLMEVNACVYSNTKSDGKLFANVGFTVIAVIEDELGRVIERPMNRTRFTHYLGYDSGYCCGWHEGKNEIILNEVGQGFVNGVETQTAA